MKWPCSFELTFSPNQNVPLPVTVALVESLGTNSKSITIVPVKWEVPLARFVEWKTPLPESENRPTSPVQGFTSGEGGSDSG